MSDVLDDLAGSASPAEGIDIPNFETGETKPAFPQGMYLFALGHIRPKFIANGSLVESVSQDIWVLRYDGEQIAGDKEWRIHFDENKVLTMPSHRGVKMMEFFPNPELKPNMKWKTSVFYKIFPNVFVDAAGQVPGNPKPVKQISWKLVTAKYGQCFSAEIGKNSYKDKEGNTKSSMQIIYDTMLLSQRVIPIEEMLRIEQKYEELKSQDSGTAGSYSVPETAIDDDLPF